MIASALRLTRADIKALRVTDAYSLHRVVYDLFDDVRSESEKQASTPSGILYTDKGGDFHYRHVLILSNRAPNKPEHGEIESRIIKEAFLQHENYRFEVTINPTKRDKQSGKTVAIKGRETVQQWFIDKAPKSWGFSINPASLQVNNLSVKTFDKKEHSVTQGSATLQGELRVINYEQFKLSFQQGVGRGRAFGFGLLQIVPISNNTDF